MAFLTTGLFIDRGVYNDGVAKDGLPIHTYRSTDSLTTIKAAGYFPAYLGSNSENVKVNDLVMLQSGSITRAAIITGVSPLTLNYTDTNGADVTTSGNWVGPFASPEPTGTITFRASGEFVNVIFPVISQTATVGASLGLDFNLSAPYRPLVEFEQPIIVQNNSVLTIQPGVTLTIPPGQNITIEYGSGVLIKSGGTLKVLT